MAARRTVAAAAAGGVGGAGDGGASEACFPGFSLVFFTGFGMARAYNQEAYQTTKPPFQFRENYFPAPEMSETRNFGVPENWDSNVFQYFIYVFD